MIAPISLKNVAIASLIFGPIILQSNSASISPNPIRAALNISEILWIIVAGSKPLKNLFIPLPISSQWIVFKNSVITSGININALVMNSPIASQLVFSITPFNKSPRFFAIPNSVLRTTCIFLLRYSIPSDIPSANTLPTLYHSPVLNASCISSFNLRTQSITF